MGGNDIIPALILVSLFVFPLSIAMTFLSLETLHVLSLGSLGGNDVDPAPISDFSLRALVFYSFSLFLSLSVSLFLYLSFLQKTGRDDITTGFGTGCGGDHGGNDVDPAPISGLSLSLSSVICDSLSFYSVFFSLSFSLSYIYLSFSFSTFSPSLSFSLSHTLSLFLSSCFSLFLSFLSSLSSLSSLRCLSLSISPFPLSLSHSLLSLSFFLSLSFL